MLNTVPKNLAADHTVHVAVAVILNQDRVLISKRADHVHQGGFWEFPGGKVEEDESIETALDREIFEELGVHIQHSRPLISVLHQYADKRVLLETRLVTAFNGREYAPDKAQAGLEGQQVRWVALEQLAGYQFPEANRGIIKALQLPQCYAISPDIDVPETVDSTDTLAQKGAIRQFLTQLDETTRQQSLLQIRIKSIKGEMLEQAVRQACMLAQKNQARVLLNSAMAVSEKLNQCVSGIHLTSEHLHDKQFVSQYQRHYPDKILAASCHTVMDIERANQLQLDFIVISPVLPTASHPGQVALGWEPFKTLSQYASMPVFALGGMSQDDVLMAQEHGAQGIAAIRSLWQDDDYKENMKG